LPGQGPHAWGGQGMSMEARNLGIIRALAWERTATGLEFSCVTELLSAARVTVSVVAPRAVRVRTTPGPMVAAKRCSYVLGRHEPGQRSMDARSGRVPLRAEHIAVEASLDPFQLAFRPPDGRLLTHQVHDDATFAGHRFGPRPGLEVESLPHDPARRVRGVVDTLLLDPEDHFYGSGERFRRPELGGRAACGWDPTPSPGRPEPALHNPRRAAW